MVDVDRRGLSAAPSGRAVAGRRRRLLHPTRHVRPRDDVRRAHRPGDRGGGSSGRRRKSRASARTSTCSPAWCLTPARSRRRSRGYAGTNRIDSSGGQRWILGARDLMVFRLTGRGDHRHFRGVTDRLDRPRRGRPRGGGAPSGDRRIDDDRRHRAPRGIGRSRREGRNARRRGRGRSSVRAARRRRHDGPAHGVLGIGRRRVGAGRACPGAGSRDLRFPRSARRLRDGGRPSLGGLGARVARAAHRSQPRRARRSRRTTSTPAPAGSSRSPGWAGLARPGGKPAPVSRSSG